MLPGPKKKSYIKVSPFAYPKEQRPHPKDVFGIKLEKLPLEQLETLLSNTEKPGPSLLANFIIDEDNGLFFNVEEIVKFSFALHQTLYRELKNNYPTLAQKLYQHNATFKELLNDLETAERGRTPREAITQLIGELERSGQRYTQQQYAAPPAIRAVDAFRKYLDDLPKKHELILVSNLEEVPKKLEPYKLYVKESEGKLEYVIDVDGKPLIGIIDTLENIPRPLTQKNLQILSDDILDIRGTAPILVKSYQMSLGYDYQQDSPISTF